MFPIRWLLILWLSLFPSTAAIATPVPLNPDELRTILTHLVQQEDQATMSGNRFELTQIFTPRSRSAHIVEGTALQRLVYIKDWAQARKIHFDRVQVSIRTRKIHWLSPDTVRVYGVDSARYAYHHLTGHRTECWFGLGVYHWYVLKKVKGRWYINDDIFIDPLNQDTRLKGPAVPAVIQVPPGSQTRGPQNMGARRALAYARHYCGAAPGCGNQNRYNPQYEDYNGNGGDCSNFISQVLRAGGFPETFTWSWNIKADDGTVAWVNAARLAQYLQRSDRATLFASGTLPALLAREGQKAPSINDLRPGDLIAYYEGGRVVHFAIVAGFDADGYPVVMSHSADRFREPWDLGWDRTTRFLFFHVHYPPA